MGEAVLQSAGDFDIVHLQNPFCYVNAVSSRAARSAGVPYFYHSRGMLQPTHLRHRWYKKLPYLWLIEKRILRGAAGLFALTVDEEKAYRRLGLNNPVYVVPNGIDAGSLATEVQDHSIPLVESLGDRQVVLFLSRLHPTKGVDLLLEAFIRIAGEYPNAALVLAGPDETGLAATLRSRAQQAGLSDRIILPGTVSGELKRNLLARADIIALPSHMEGFSMVVLEGLGSGKPVVITPHCHFPDVAQAGAGIIVDTDAGQIAGAMGKLLADPDQARQMGAKGRELVMQHYQWDAIARQTVAAYEEAIG